MIGSEHLGPRRRRRGRVTIRESRVWTGAALAIGLGATGAPAQTAIPPTARDFALTAVQSDQYEILSGYVALAQSRNPRVRAFARQMIDAHARDSDSVAQAAKASGLPRPPPAMSADQAAMLAALQSLTGEAFDQAYSKQQMLVHEQALSVGQSYAADGSDPNLRALAKAAMPPIKQHLEMAQRLRSSLRDADKS